MADENPQVPHRKKDDFDRKFTPTGTLLLMALYILTIGVAWGYVYFADLLARR